MRENRSRWSESFVSGLDYFSSKSSMTTGVLAWMLCLIPLGMWTQVAGLDRISLLRATRHRDSNRLFLNALRSIPAVCGGGADDSGEAVPRSRSGRHQLHGVHLGPGRLALHDAAATRLNRPLEQR